MINFDKIESEGVDIDIKLLSKQIIKECLYPVNQNNSQNYGNMNEKDANFCYGMISRINNLVNTKIYDKSFNFSNSLSNEKRLTNIINDFIADEQQEEFVLRIGFEELGYEFQAREILANAIGRYLLKLAREGSFKKEPVVLVLDEAHQFLSKSVVDDFFKQMR